MISICCKTYIKYLLSNFYQLVKSFSFIFELMIVQERLKKFILEKILKKISKPGKSVSKQAIRCFLTPNEIKSNF